MGGNLIGSDRRAGLAVPTPLPMQTHRVRLDQLEQGNAPCGHAGEMEAVRPPARKAMTFRRFPGAPTRSQDRSEEFVRSAFLWRRKRGCTEYVTVSQTAVGIREGHGASAGQECGKYVRLDRQIDREVQKNASQECGSERRNVRQHVLLSLSSSSRPGSCTPHGLIKDALLIISLKDAAAHDRRHGTSGATTAQALHAVAAAPVEPTARPPPKAQSNPGALYRSPGGFWGSLRDLPLPPAGVPLWPWCHSGGRTPPTTGPHGRRGWLPRWATERTRYRGSALRAGPEPVAPTE
jgi:hypothetical protein